jgi:hypothetical protein
VRRARLIAVLVVCALAFLLPLQGAGTALAKSKSPYTTLKLKNGWQNAPFATSKAQVRDVSGIVYFKGAISTSGANAVPFVLPRAFRPHTWVYVPVDMCGATNGRLTIAPNGTTTVEAESSFANAQCFTSLDGASFALSAKSFTTLSPRNGWTNAPFNTSDIKARNLDGIVHFKGAMSTSGTNAKAFTLPRSLRPHTSVYVPVDMCNATNGRLIITPNGAVNVEAESSFADAQCFTSLDGASFALSAKSFTTLSPRNGWTNAPFSSSDIKARNLDGIVHFKGAMSTSGTNTKAFTLPRSLRPHTRVYVPVDMCNATDGRLIITPNGAVNVEAESSFANAKCFTSLDGAWFARG